MTEPERPMRDPPTGPPRAILPLEPGPRPPRGPSSVLGNCIGVAIVLGFLGFLLIVGLLLLGLGRCFSPRSTRDPRVEAIPRPELVTEPVA